MTKKELPHHKRWPFWLSVGILFCVFIYLIRAILLPFVLGICIAYFIHPAVDRLEKAGMARGASALVIIACFFAVIAALSILIVPVIAGQFSGLITAMPDYLSEFDQKYTAGISRWAGHLPATEMASIKSAAADFSGSVIKLAGSLITGVFQSGVAAAHLLSLILITPVVAFYLLRDWDYMVLRLDTLLPRNSAGVIREQLAVIDRTLAGFVHGQINVCLIMATYYAIGLSMAGLKFSIIIGLITGLLVIVPYAGFLLGMTVGLSVAFFQFDNYAQIGAVLGIFLLGTTMETSIITPRLVGKKVGLHPVWVIFGLLAGATLFGFVGILLAVPVTAVIAVLLRFALDRYLQSEYYEGV